MAAEQTNGQSAETQNPSEFFEAIGSRVNNISSTAGDGENESRPVEEIESLCMNCHENVRIKFWKILGP